MGEWVTGWVRMCLCECLCECGRERQSNTHKNITSINKWFERNQHDSGNIKGCTQKGHSRSEYLPVDKYGVKLLTQSVPRLSKAVISVISYFCLKCRS